MSVISEFVFEGAKKFSKEAIKDINQQAAINRSLNPNTIHGNPIKVPKMLKFIGKYGGNVFTLYGAYDVNDKWVSGEYNTKQMAVEQVSNGIGGIPVWGTPWSIGWTLGKDYGPSKWYGNDDTSWFR